LGDNQGGYMPKFKNAMTKKLWEKKLRENKKQKEISKQHKELVENAIVNERLDDESNSREDEKEAE
tara:strand:+ start:48 stop:245 length:198 start_codon:yes stop_codon:yes gene_type:complete